VEDRVAGEGVVSRGEFLEGCHEVSWAHHGVVGARPPHEPR
jgi:hypothetical protein